MIIHNYIKLFSEKIIIDSKLNNDTKNQLLNYINECNSFELIQLLLDGKIQKIQNNNEKQIILKELKNSNLPNKIKHFIINEDVPYLGTVADMSDAYRAERISDKYKGCEEDCKDLDGKQKQICKSNCKSTSYESVISELRSGLRNCQYRQNPEQCRNKLNNLISKLEQKINKQSEKIEKYEEEIEQQNQNE